MVRGNRRSAQEFNGNGGAHAPSPVVEATKPALQSITVYAYGVARNRLIQAARRLNVPLEVVDDFGHANAVVTLKNYYRRRPKVITDAERRGMAIYVLRANTVSQMENFLTDVYRLDEREQTNPLDEAMLETEQAIMRIRSGEEYVILAPQNSDIRKQQHDLARQNNLYSKSVGKEPKRHVRIYAEEESE